jgi:hypothetical protein
MLVRRAALAVAVCVASVAWGSACGGDAFVVGGGATGGAAGSVASSSASGSSVGGGTSSSSGSASGGSSASSSGTGGGGGAGCGAQQGDCSNDNQCPAGSSCVALTTCGYRVCSEPHDEAPSCQGMFDECCNSSECAQGKCYSGPLGPYCGGLQQAPYNMCMTDECTADSDCPPPPAGFVRVCTPAGTFGRAVRTCINASCRIDADCNEEPGGRCAPVQTACCDGPVSLFCVYPSNGCERPGDCPTGNCNPDGARARCFATPPVCPL